MSTTKIKTALISVYNKEGLEPIIKNLSENNVKIISTGGTKDFIEGLGVEVEAVEDLTTYPSIFGGRVKTLHPKIFGGILYRRNHPTDKDEASQYDIPAIDLVIVDLYPFEETVAGGGTEEEIIEKIDIGGISLIRAAAKNFNDLLIVSSREQYDNLLELLKEKNCSSEREDRKKFATMAFDISSHYDTCIFNYFNGDGQVASFKKSIRESTVLRYGENPHQKGVFYGNINNILGQLSGKELSYNNLVDIEAALDIVGEFGSDTVFVIIKHTNACGVATADTLKESYLKALEADPVSAFGGILATNKRIDLETAEEINKLFYEVLIAPGYEEEALQLLMEKKKRIIIQQNVPHQKTVQFKDMLDGVLVQDKDTYIDRKENFKVATDKAPTSEEILALEFALKVCKHTKSNTIVLSTKDQLLASGVGQTSRVDALKQAIEKAYSVGYSLKGAVMASDAFFPFPDCVEIAGNEGISAVIQPGGSVKDQDSIDYCNKEGISMVFTGIRHFKH